MRAPEGPKIIAPGKRSAARGQLNNDDEPWRGERKHQNRVRHRRHSVAPAADLSFANILPRAALRLPGATICGPSGAADFPPFVVQIQVVSFGAQFSRTSSSITTRGLGFPRRNNPRDLYFRELHLRFTSHFFLLPLFQKFGSSL